MTPPIRLDNCRIPFVIKPNNSASQKQSHAIGASAGMYPRPTFGAKHIGRFRAIHESPLRKNAYIAAKGGSMTLPHLFVMYYCTS